MAHTILSCELSRFNAKYIMFDLMAERVCDEMFGPHHDTAAGASYSLIILILIITTMLRHICSMPYDLCNMPYDLCSMPYDLCHMQYAI